MVPFQCEFCHVINLRGTEAHATRDCALLAYLRRANIDAFWSREPNTIADNLREVRRMQRTGDWLRIGCIAPPLGPFPIGDTLGLRAALAVLDRSQDRLRVTFWVVHEN